MADVEGRGLASGTSSSSSSRAPPLRSSSKMSVKVVGFALQRWFSAPLTFDASIPRTFSICSPTLPDHLAQFQEVYDIALGAMPPFDWMRCQEGDATVSLMVRQVRDFAGPRSDDRFRGPEPSNEQDVIMNMPHNDEFWPGGDHFVVSDGPWRTMFFEEGVEAGVTTRFPERVVVRYDASHLHAAPGFCPAGVDERHLVDEHLARRRRVLRTFVRIVIFDPRLSSKRLRHFEEFLRPPPPAEWQRPRTCDAEDVIHGCFDEEHSCERCCDLSKGPMGDSICWAGWITYQKCCGPASRRWAGCGWYRGVDLWAHEFYSLTPPKLHSPAQCQQRCEEDADCGGWTFFPEAWEPYGCRLPLAGIMSAKGSCVLRTTAEGPQTPHRSLVWGPRDCDDGDDGCLEFDTDRLSRETEYKRDIPDVAACRRHCKLREDCHAFAFFPWDYVGDPSGDCVLPTAMRTYWENRCLLKSFPTSGSEGWFIPMGSVISGSRRCSPVVPWLQKADDLLAEARLAIDGNYGRSACSRRNPWHVHFDAEYMVSEVILWSGDLDSLQQRTLRNFVVHILTLSKGEQIVEVPCGVVTERNDGHPVTLRCQAEKPVARGIVVRSETTDVGSDHMSLCEVEVRLEPVPCKELIEHSVLIGPWEVRVFPFGAATLVDPSTPAGQACERLGGGLVGVHARGGGLVCVEASCAPSPCLQAFDADIDLYAGVSGFTIWDERLEAAEEMCSRFGPVGGPDSGGRYFETTVRIHEEGKDYPVVTMHFGFCAPGICRDDGASTVALRIAGGKGIDLNFLPPGAGVSIQNVRPFGRWEDVKLDFLIAGFARSGTHSVQGNLALHPECLVAKEEMTFNWGYLPLSGQIWEYHRHFLDDSDGKLLHGGKGEGVSFSPRLLRLLKRVPKLKLIIVVREPIEWLESLYNLRALGCRVRGHCAEVPPLSDIILEGVSLEDVRADYAELARAVEDATTIFPPERLLLLEFELLKARPREFFNRICDFLGISHFPMNFSFEAYATSDRKAYTADGTKADLCGDPRLRPALDALRARLAARGEHQRLANLLAASGQPWVSSRLLLGKDHCA